MYDQPEQKTKTSGRRCNTQLDEGKEWEKREDGYNHNPLPFDNLKLYLKNPLEINLKDLSIDWFTF
jgi:hypothetical protein